MLTEFNGNHAEQKQVKYMGPMLMIVVFLVIEIVPFVFVLDWNFMEIFIAKQFPTTTTEPLFEPQGQNISYVSLASQRDHLAPGMIFSNN